MLRSNGQERMASRLRRHSSCSSQVGKILGFSWRVSMRSRYCSADGSGVGCGRAGGGGGGRGSAVGVPAAAEVVAPSPPGILAPQIFL